jgi:hypothetical protein
MQRIADQRPEAALQRQVQAWGNGSERVGQLRAWQGVADGRGGKSQDLTLGIARQAKPAAPQAIAQLTPQEAVALAKQLFRGGADQINSWADIDRLKYCFTPEERSQLRSAANNNSEGAMVRAAWVESDVPQAFLPASQAEVQGLVERVINQIVDTVRSQGPQQLTEAVLEKIPYVGVLMTVRNVGNNLAELATAISESDGIGAATATSSLISTLFGQQYLGYAATGVNAIRTTATNYTMKTGAYKALIGKKD